MTRSRLVVVIVVGAVVLGVVLVSLGIAGGLSLGDADGSPSAPQSVAVPDRAPGPVAWRKLTDDERSAIEGGLDAVRNGLDADGTHAGGPLHRDAQAGKDGALSSWSVVLGWDHVNGTVTVSSFAHRADAVGVGCMRDLHCRTIEVDGGEVRLQWSDKHRIATYLRDDGSVAQVWASAEPEAFKYGYRLPFGPGALVHVVTDDALRLP